MTLSRAFVPFVPPLVGYKLKRQRAIEKALKAPKKLRLAAILKIVRSEVEEAGKLFEQHHSAHESYGVLMEEVDELWDEIKVQQHLRSYPKMAKEAVQVAAMAIRLITDICAEAKHNGEMVSVIADPMRLSKNVVKRMREREKRAKDQNLDRAWKTVNRVVYRKSRARS